MQNENKHVGIRHCFLLFVLSIVLYVSCSTSPRNTKTDTVSNAHKDTSLQKPGSSFSDTITIDFPAAVFYNPDSLQMKKLKAITDTMIFEGIMHDCFYQMKSSRLVLKRYYTHIKIIEVKNSR